MYRQIPYAVVCYRNYNSWKERFDWQRLRLNCLCVCGKFSMVWHLFYRTFLFLLVSCAVCFSRCDLPSTPSALHYSILCNVVGLRVVFGIPFFLWLISNHGCQWWWWFFFTVMYFSYIESRCGGKLFEIIFHDKIVLPIEWMNNTTQINSCATQRLSHNRRWLTTVV